MFNEEGILYFDCEEGNTENSFSVKLDTRQKKVYYGGECKSFLDNIICYLENTGCARLHSDYYGGVFEYLVKLILGLKYDGLYTVEPCVCYIAESGVSEKELNKMYDYDLVYALLRSEGYIHDDFMFW